MQELIIHPKGESPDGALLPVSGAKEVLDGPDTDIDRIIRPIRNSHGKISNKILQGVSFAK